MFALIAAVNIEHTWQLISRYRWRSAAVLLGLLTALAWMTLTRLVNVGVNFYTISRYPWELFVGRETPQQFLQRNLPDYEALRFMGEHLEGNPPRLVDISNGQRFYSEDAVIYSSGGYSQFAERLMELRDPRKILDALREKHIDYLVVNQPRYEAQWGWRKTPPTILSQAFLDAFTRPLFARNRVRIYKLLPRQAVDRLPDAGNLLENGGFDQLNGEGKPAGWVVVGNATVDASGRAARSAPIALRASFQDFAYQRVGVRPGAVYTVSAFMRADKPGQNAIVEFVWLDENQQIICSDIMRAAVGPTWQRREDLASWRDGAVTCQIDLRGEPGCEVWFDDVQLSETVAVHYTARR